MTAFVPYAPLNRLKALGKGIWIVHRPSRMVILTDLIEDLATILRV